MHCNLRMAAELPLATTLPERRDLVCPPALRACCLDKNFPTAVPALPCPALPAERVEGEAAAVASAAQQQAAGLTQAAQETAEAVQHKAAGLVGSALATAQVSVWDCC